MTKNGMQSSDTRGVNRPVRILGISGSLRARSSNTEVLRAASLLAPPRARVTLFPGLDALPHFNPDLDGEGMVPPPQVARLRDCIRRSDALFISSPEYAHGVPGALKNALDWLVSDPRVVNVPVGLLNASPRSQHAMPSLAETLRTMSMAVIAAACITVPVMGRDLDAVAIARDEQLRSALSEALHALVLAARERGALDGNRIAVEESRQAGV